MAMEDHPEWARAVAREANIRSGLVLYGNTRDLVWSGRPNEYVTVPQLLLDILGAPARGAPTVRACWDRADGLRFAAPAEQRRWTDVVERAVGSPAGGAAYDLGDTPAQAASGPIDLVELIARFRQVAAAPGERPLLVIEWSHLLVTQPAHPDAAERAWLVQLGKALVGEPQQRIDSDRLERSRGLVVLVGADLGAIPPGLYRGEPRVRLLAVPPPSRGERRRFFERHHDDLRLAVPRTATGGARPPTAADALEVLADLTDQLTVADLRQILALSRAEGAREPLPPDRLLNLYRFGERRSPWEDLSHERLEHVGEDLRRRVIGQPAAVDHVETMILRAALGLAGLEHSARRTKPKGTLFFVGPTGVGKTELAKAIAEFLFGDETACVRFDMSEYNHEHSDQRLVGAPPGYVGFEAGGQLTNAVTARPFSVLLFDEIEKAHGRVLDKFLQILEDGRLTDGRGETAWFSESVIIFTSNIGAATAPAEGVSYEEHFRGEVEQHFVRTLGRPELLNRLGDNIVVFRRIEDEALRRGILERKLQPLREHLKARWGVNLKIEEAVVHKLIASARNAHGGRGLINEIERSLVNPLSKFMFGRLQKLRQGRAIVVSLDGERLDFDLSEGAGR